MSSVTPTQLFGLKFQAPLSHWPDRRRFVRCERSLVYNPLSYWQLLLGTYFLLAKYYSLKDS